MLLKTGIVQEQTKALQTYFSFANVFVTIDPRIKRSLGVVYVEESESFQANDLVKCGERVFIGYPGADVIAGSECVGRVEADTKTVTVLRFTYDEGDLLEC
jgi:hypothetical protein